MTNSRVDPKAVKVTKTGVSLWSARRGRTEPRSRRTAARRDRRAPNVADVGLETTKAEIEKAS